MAKLRAHRRSAPMRRAAAYLAVASLFPGGAYAAKLDYDVGISVMHSDNIGLSETNEVADTVVSPELRFNAEQRGTALQFLLQGDIRYPHYMDNTFDDDLQGSLFGSLEWNILPERISFQATDTLSRQSVNALDSFVPSNQQQVNVFTAGPTFTARFNAATRGQLDVLYTNTYAEESTDFQGDRYSAEGRIERQLSSTDVFTLNAGTLRTHYDSTGAFYDYDRYDAFLGYNSRLASLDIEVEAGYSRVKPRNYDGESSSPLFRGNVEWRVTPRTSLVAGVLYEFSDAAQNLVLRRDPTDGPPVVDPLDPALRIGPQTFRQRQVNLGYYFTGERFSVRVNPYYERIRYLTASTENQDVQAVSTNFDWRLKPGLDLSVALVRQKREYNDLARNDTTTLMNIALTRQLARHWIGRAYLQRSERDSSSAPQSYSDNAIMLSIIYRR